MPDTATRDFAAEDPSLSAGTTHQGFVVERTEALPELDGRAYIMRHEATGARLMWLACADTDRSFAISFKTPPADDTGVFHILEHSVLCGSGRYPVKEPFVNLLKSSMQTFLNAMTFPDKTMYPVASTNVADLENLMGVYLDAVFDPAIYSKPHIFEQEGWHYELDDDGRLTYNGVVFNEMKGALSDPDDVLYNTLHRALFPDNAYSCESGGNPRSIPQLSYEGFLDTHSRHYRLDNSFTILYGDLDIERELAFIGERFDEAPVRDAGEPNALVMQEPVRPELVRHEMATSPENACCGLAYVCGTSHERERLLALEVLLDTLLGSNEAPLKRVLLDSGIANDVSYALMDGQLQPYLLIELKGAKEGAAEQLRGIVEGECARLAAEGIERDALEASLSQAEFNMREGDFGGTSDGVYYSIMAMSGWLYDEADAACYLRYEDALAKMRAGLEGDYFERLLEDVVCKSVHTACVDIVPVEEGDAAEEAAELAEIRAGMDEADIARIQADVAELREEQERPDSPEALATLPQLSLADIGEAPAEVETVEAEGPAPCVRHLIPTHGIDYIHYYFDLSCLAFEELPHAAILSSLLGKLGTVEHSARELDTLVESRLGNLSFFNEAYAMHDDADDARAHMVVGVSVLSEKAADAVRLPAEVWASTQLDDPARVRDILQQRKIAIEQGFINAGHTHALARTSTYFSRSAMVADQMSGIEHYRALCEVLDDFDAGWPALLESLESIRSRVFAEGNVEMSFVGSEDDLARLAKMEGEMRLFPAHGHAGTLEVGEPELKHEAFVTPANVVFVGEGASGRELGARADGVWQVATRALSFDYLWNEVRVKGGAYGCGFRYTPGSLMQFWSYRDPGVDATIERFERAASWLAKWNPTPEEHEGYVIATVAGYDSPTKPRAAGRRQDIMRMTGRPKGWRTQLRGEALGATVEEIRSRAEALAHVSEGRGICVFGNRDAVEASGLDLEIIELL